MSSISLFVKTLVARGSPNRIWVTREKFLPFGSACVRGGGYCQTFKTIKPWSNLCRYAKPLVRLGVLICEGSSYLNQFRLDQGKGLGLLGFAKPYQFELCHGRPNFTSSIFCRGRAFGLRGSAKLCISAS